MKHTTIKILLSCLLLTIVVVVSLERQVAFTILLSSTGIDFIQGVSCTADAFYVSGYTGGNLPFNATNSMTSTSNNDAFMAKYNTRGEFLWGVGLGSSAIDFSYSIAASEDAVFATGSTNGNLFNLTNSGIADVFVTKYSSTGVNKWNKLFSTALSEVGYGITIGSDGVYVVGSTGGDLTVDTVKMTNTGSSDAFLVKLDLNTGVAIWGTLVASTAAEQANGVSVGPDGSVVVVGQTYGSISISGQKYTSAGSADAFIAKYSSTGDFQWLKGFGSVKSDNAASVAIDSSNNVYVAGLCIGELNGLPDFGEGDSVLIKYSSTGTVVWTRRINCVSKDAALSVAMTSSGTVVMSGYYTGSVTFAQTSFTSLGLQDTYVVEYSANGDELWISCGGGTGIDYSFGVATNGNDIYSVGRTAGSANWGKFSIQPPVVKGQNDGFVVKYTTLEDCSSSTYKNDPVCTTKSVCVTNSQCACASGFGGSYCTMNRTCNSTLLDSSNVCNGHGKCVDVDTCECNAGYHGQFCQYPTCFNVNASNSSVCSGNGQCKAVDQCQCNTGWTGQFCQYPICFNVSASNSSVCSGNGQCEAVDQCQCNTGWTGQFCSIPVCFSVSAANTTNVCSGHGSCTAPNTCSCSSGRSGGNCEIPFSCYGTGFTSASVCSGHGTCVSSDECICADGYAGYMCQRKCDYCYISYHQL
jgi:hypothetical protein